MVQTKEWEIRINITEAEYIEAVETIIQRELLPSEVDLISGAMDVSETQFNDPAGIQKRAIVYSIAAQVAQSFAWPGFPSGGMKIGG